MSISVTIVTDDVDKGEIMNLSNAMYYKIIGDDMQLVEIELDPGEDRIFAASRFRSQRRGYSFIKKWPGFKK